MRVLTSLGVSVGSVALAFALSGCAQNDSDLPEGERAADRARDAQTKQYEADNTGRNAEPADRLTPMDQGTSEEDVRITQEIRQALMDGDDFSVNAQNVKVITREGKVTLRGPILDATERSRIEAIAKQIAGTGNVTSQLEYETSQN